jgi:hypothetical protein
VLPLWADALILAGLPVILTVALLIWGKEEPGNAVVHQQENEKRDEDPDLQAAAA